MTSFRSLTYSTSIISAFLFFLLLLGCNDTPPKTTFISDDDFNWSLNIPETFKQIGGDEWEIMQNKGSEAMQENFGEEFENGSKSLFVFRSGDKNYFESNLVDMNGNEQGAYELNYNESNQILYQTFKNQMPGIKIDTAASKERINGLAFYKFKMKVYYPNADVLNIILYNRLFGNRELAVNIMYTDDEKGAAILDSWRNSNFGQPN